VSGRNRRTEEFETAAIPHLNGLYRTAARITGNRTEAEDLVQETFLQAWKSFDRFETGTNCRAWLFKILFHVVQQHRRKWYNAKVIIDGNESWEKNVAYEPPVPQQLCDEDVLAAFERIPLQYREVVLLADVEEFAYREIAETLSIPIGTVMSRLSRGREMLRRELAGFAVAHAIKDSGRTA
jgi:RNA polymerase sigma-70 factor (ECF subfamily)